MLILFTGCEGDNTAIPKHGASMYDDSSVVLNRGTKTLDITIDSGYLQIYCWDKKNIKLETKHNIRGNKTDEELEELLKNYSIMSKEEDSTLFFTVDYDGTIKKPQDIYTDIKLTIPKQIKKLNISQQYGKIIIRDKFEGNIEADLDYVNSEIKSLKGQLLYECDNGNLRLNSAKLLNQSFANINSGNIFVKAKCQEKSNYSFKTKSGNIDTGFPLDISAYNHHCSHFGKGTSQTCDDCGQDPDPEFEDQQF
jgi:hypothetical protein